MVFSATFNNIWVILWQSVLLVEETRENHWSAASHWQILSHNVVSSTPRLSGIQTHNVSGDSHWLAYVVVNPPIIRSLPRQPLKDWEICCLHVDLTWRYKHFCIKFCSINVELEFLTQVVNNESWLLFLEKLKPSVFHRTNQCNLDKTQT
jgi:hypothetical protein